MGRELAQEILKVWTTNHYMIQAKNQRNPYIFIYGFEQKAEGIPLTRSKRSETCKNWAVGWRGLRSCRSARWMNRWWQGLYNLPQHGRGL